MLVVINASPYEIHKQREREQVARARVRDVGLPVAYVNMVGGQDELVFDGNSFVMDARGEVVMRAPAFEEGTYLVEFARAGDGALVPRAGRDRRGAFRRGERLWRAGARACATTCASTASRGW